MTSKAKTVAEYLASLTPDERAALQAVRDVFLRNLGADCAEIMQYGMIGYAVPHSVFPAGYHCDPSQPLPYAGLAARKGHMSLHLMGVYMDQGNAYAKWFHDAWAASGKKLDMGKACIRFKKAEDVPLDVLAEAIRRMPPRKYVEVYTRILDTRRSGAAAKKKKAPAKRPVKAAKKAPKKTAKTSARR